MKRLRFLSLMIAAALLLSAVGVAEELGEMDLYDESIYIGENAVEAPAVEPEEAGQAEAAPSVAESGVAEPVAGDTSGPEPQPAPMQAVALTGRKATAEMNVDEKLQITVNEGETGTFTSKSAKLAAVDEKGLVTALAKGTAKIEFKPDGGKKRASPRERRSP